MRRALVLWHRWFGLIAALWLLLMAVTGSILVFYQEIDRALNPDLFAVSSGPTLPVDRLAEAAGRVRADHRTDFINLPDRPGDPAMAYLVPDSAASYADGETLWQVFIDPANGAILGIRDYYAIDLDRRGITNFLYRLHYSLHLGEWAVWLLGLVAFLWLIDHLLALGLSFPKGAIWWRSFTVRRGKRGYKRHFDLHRAIGLWLYPVTLTLAVTGINFNWPETFRAAVDALSPITPPRAEAVPLLLQPQARASVGWQAAIERVAPLRVDGMGYDPSRGLYALYAYDQRDIDGSGGRELLIDGDSGRIVADSHRADGSVGDVVMAWQFPLHSGKAFGWWGRIAVFLTGIALSAIIVTGLTMWARKLAGRQKRAGRRRMVEPQSPAVLSPAE